LDYQSFISSFTSCSRNTGEILLLQQVTPGRQLLANIHDETDWKLAYASFVNVLDYTNVVIPVTNADRKIDVFDHDYTPLNDKDKKNWLACKFHNSHVKQA
jgi:amidase